MLQTIGAPLAAVGAEKDAVTGATADVERTLAGNEASPAKRESPPNPALLAFSDFSGCGRNFAGFSDHADNYLQPDPADGSKCAAGIGANHVTYGKLMTRQFPVSRDVWMSGYIYFPASFKLPAASAGPNGVCNGGVHLWRLHEGLTAASNRISLDFNVPAGLDVIQFYVFRHDDRQNFTKSTSYKPAKLTGQWQYWQLHVSLGTPGKHDGFLRFYADGRLVDSMEKQPFLPAEADATWGFTYADMQSNIGGCSAQWPEQNGWLVRDVRVCKNSPC